MNKLQISGFLDNSAVNGEGLRSVLFLSGCYHQCPGCHNLDMQDPNYGEGILRDDLILRIKDNTPIINGVTISGGEPFLQWKELLPLLEEIKGLGLTIWMYTGYVYEELYHDENMKRLLPLIDVLVDGPFIEGLASPDSLYIGSSNQRILKLDKGKITCELYF